MSRDPDFQLCVVLTFFQAWYGLLFNRWFLLAALVLSATAIYLENASLEGGDLCLAALVAIAAVAFVIRFVSLWKRKA